MSTLGNQHCAVCSKRVPAGRLMCMEHWRQVPLRLQRDVWRTWKAFQERRTPFEGLRLLAQYRQASDAAIHHVRSINPQMEEAR